MLLQRPCPIPFAAWTLPRAKSCQQQVGLDLLPCLLPPQALFHRMPLDRLQEVVVLRSWRGVAIASTEVPRKVLGDTFRASTSSTIILGGPTLHPLLRSARCECCASCERALGTHPKGKRETASAGAAQRRGPEGQHRNPGPRPHPPGLKGPFGPKRPLGPEGPSCLRRSRGAAL